MNSIRPASCAGTTASAPSPAGFAARHSNDGSPTGSAAAINSNRRVSSGSSSSCRRKLCWIRAVSGATLGSSNPPASSDGDRPRGSSRSASGFPRDSAMRRSRTCSSSRPGHTESSSSRASRSTRPPSRSSGSPCSSRISLGSRTANSSPIDSASRRRATNAMVSADALSSHWASSITHRSGCSAAASESRLSTASPTTNRSAGAFAPSPNAVSSASRCGPGSRPTRSSIGAHSWCRPAKGSSISYSTPAAWPRRQPDARSSAYFSSADFPIPASPRMTSTGSRSPGRRPAVGRAPRARRLGRAAHPGRSGRHRPELPRRREAVVGTHVGDGSVQTSTFLTSADQHGRPSTWRHGTTPRPKVDLMRTTHERAIGAARPGLAQVLHSGIPCPSGGLAQTHRAPGRDGPAPCPLSASLSGVASEREDSPSQPARCLG